MRTVIQGLGSVVMMGCLVVLAVADEEKVPLSKLPEKVVSAVKARFAGAELVSASKETENGETVYEVAIKFKGSTIEVTLKPDGTITEIEKEITAKDLPKPVSEALEKKYPKATFKKLEEVTKVENKVEKLAYYEVLLVTAEKKTIEVSVAADGKIVKEEKKDNEKDESKKEDKKKN